MRKLAVLMFQTLDGVIQGPSSPDEDPSDGFTQGGWAVPYWEGVMAQVLVEAMDAPYDILFGRRTYDIFAGHRPGDDPENPAATKLHQARKYVVTSQGGSLEWNNSYVLKGGMISAVTRLKAENGPLLQTHGSGQLVHSLLAAGLVDELRLWTFPVVLGAGRKMFPNGSPLASFQTLKSVPVENGTVMTIYRSAGRP
ncbi:dihydrofolate reductase family protein [Roseibium polysiphoniae]|uniref:dihydrofolate reductase family protein n=1 Tax=Roseibium polysiphoniae TaxID=2571221 RepID=UPI003299B1E7